jgi:hypothetical protein
VVLSSPRASLFATLLVAACLDPREYPCTVRTQCVVDGKEGMCHAGWCAYPDDECESGQRFGPAAGDGLAGDCVGIDTDGGSASAGETTSASTLGIESTTADCGDCSVAEGPCWAANGTCNTATGECEYEPLAIGTLCEDDDPCTMVGQCDGAGECVPGAIVTCDDPKTCQASPGECDANGDCVYELLPAGSDCEDGDGCTLGDTCDAAGSCLAGPNCASDDPCQVGACEAGACAFSAAIDGTSCGADPADRCCAGACTDISSDAANCGGCGATCQSDEICESIAVTTECSAHPAATSGRCTCDGANADCPHGQVCVTLGPVLDRCAPFDGADCPGGLFHDLPDCPNYCEYGD